MEFDLLPSLGTVAEMESGLGARIFKLEVEGMRVDEGAGEDGSLGRVATSETDGMDDNLRDEDGVGRDGNEDEGIGFGEGTILFTLRIEASDTWERNAGPDDGGTGKA